MRISSKCKKHNKVYKQLSVHQILQSNNYPKLQASENKLYIALAQCLVGNIKIVTHYQQESS